MNILYVRVSSVSQATDRQEILQEEYNCKKVYVEKVSGKNKERPELKEMLGFVREGDVVIVESISRFARNTRDLLELIDILNSKGVGFVSKKESIDTTTPQGRFMLTVFGAISELERDSILQRQREGIAIAKAMGKHLGRPKVDYPKNWKEEYEKWMSGKQTAKKTMDILGLKRTTFYKRVREYRIT